MIQHRSLTALQDRATEGTDLLTLAKTLAAELLDVARRGASIGYSLEELATLALEESAGPYRAD